MLSTTEFLDQQEVLGNAYAGLVTVETMLESGLTMVAAVDDVPATLDLIEPYSSTFQEQMAATQAGRLRTATLALIGHVETRTGQPINGWLYTNGLKVSQNFASLSGVLGVEINVLNIE